MKVEIGSEFWTGSTPLNGSGVASLLPKGMESHYTLCGRTALELVLRDAMQARSVRKAYLPSYCCHTMIEPFSAKGIEVVFYPVFFGDMGLCWDFNESNDCDLVLLMDYFGFRSEHTFRIAQNQKAKGKLVLYDATHSLFCENMDYTGCDYVFGSVRKWFGVSAGFCAKAGSWTSFPALKRNVAYTRMRNAAFDDKRRFIAGEPVDKQRFLNAFSQAEESLETDYIGYGPDTESAQILETVNVAYIRRKRRENAAYLQQALGHAETIRFLLPPQKADCPLFVPILLPQGQRDGLRRHLIENQIYCPVHWPAPEGAVSNIYARELSLVCDQRYSVADMERTLATIGDFIKKD